MDIALTWLDIFTEGISEGSLPISVQARPSVFLGLHITSPQQLKVYLSPLLSYSLFSPVPHYSHASNLDTTISLAMSFQLAFGSFGDFVTLIQIIQELATLIRDAVMMRRQPLQSHISNSTGWRGSAETPVIADRAYSAEPIQLPRLDGPRSRTWMSLSGVLQREVRAGSLIGMI